MDDKQRALRKFKTVFDHTDTVIPDSTVVEQASSEATARFASSLIRPGSIVADLTAGLGVNTYFFSKVAKKVFAVERDAARSSALENNLRIAGVRNVEVINEDCIDWIQKYSQKLDYAYVDPSRRNSVGKKVFLLQDCSPDMLELLPLLKEKCVEVLIKTSPLLDIKAALSAIDGIYNINIIEYKREVKELIIHIRLDENEPQGKPVSISIVRIDDSGKYDIDRFSVEDWNANSKIVCLVKKKDVEIGGYLYEPSPAMMKGGFFGVLAERYKEFYKLSENTHLFYSKYFYPDFSGRIFHVVNALGSSDLKKLKGENFNVISRNHPASAAEIEKRYKLKSSDNRFIIAATVGKEKAIFHTDKITDR